MEQLTHWLIENVWMIPVYPLLGFFLILLIRVVGGVTNDSTKKFCMATTVLATFMGLMHTLPFVSQLLAGQLQDIQVNVPWLKAGNFVLSMGYLIDPMSVMMLFVVTFISLFIQIYTHGYMEKDPGYSKFYAYLALFNFSMLGLVLSTNLFQMYIFWELVGVSSYLLIGFWFTRPDAAAASVKAFLMNRVGDFGLLIGILLFLFMTFNWWMTSAGNEVLLSFTGMTQFAQAAHLNPGLLPPAGVMTLIAILIFMGPMAKSAQVPLHTWLPDAMAGPTPISALIHAATMVAAGVYLVGRVFPVFQLSPSAMIFVAVIGTITAVIAATIALTQTDIKKALAYSTCSQLGFMVAAMGCGAFAAGLFHLFTHAFFKAMLFLCSGSVIHACEDEQDMTKMGGLLKKLPITGWTYLIGTLSISGMLWTSGFWSKDEILVGAQSFNMVIFWILAITAGVTAFYMFRTFYMTFLGEYRGEAHVHHESSAMVLPLVVLAVPSLIIGFLLSGKSGLVGLQLPSFSDMIVLTGMNHGHEVAHGATHGAAHHGPFSHDQIGYLSMGLGLAGFALATLMYWKPLNDLPGKLRSSFSPLYQLFLNKWYFDTMYGAFVDKVYLVFAEASARFDKGFIDGIVNWTGTSVMGTGGALRKLQTGKVQTYVAVVAFSVVILTLLLMYWFL